MAFLNPIQLLADSVETLWFWTYGLVAGWGLTVTIIVVALILLSVRQIRMQQRLYRLENRLINAEREFSLSQNKNYK